MMNALNILPSYTEYFSLSAATIGLNSGIVWIGAIFGSLALAKLPDHIGRKPAVFYSALMAIIGSLLQGAAQDIAMFLVARFILGFGLGGTYVAGPLLIAETLPQKLRPYGLGAFTDLYYAGGLLSAGAYRKYLFDRPSCLLNHSIRCHVRDVADAVNMGLAPAFLVANHLHSNFYLGIAVYPRVAEISCP